MSTKPVEYVYALYNFEAENPDEVSFKVGERVLVVEKDDAYGDGWFQGTNERGETGLFPFSYTTYDEAAARMMLNSATSQAPADKEATKERSTTAVEPDATSKAAPTTQTNEDATKERRTDDVALGSIGAAALGAGGAGAGAAAASATQGPAKSSGVLHSTMNDIDNALSELKTSSPVIPSAAEEDEDDDGSENGFVGHAAARAELAKKARMSLAQQAQAQAEEQGGAWNASHGLGEPGSISNAKRMSLGGTAPGVTPLAMLEMSDESEDEEDAMSATPASPTRTTAEPVVPVVPIVPPKAAPGANETTAPVTTMPLVTRSDVTEPVKPAESEPVKPMEAVKDEPAKPAESIQPEPATVVQSEPVKVVQPEPVKVTQPEPAKVAQPEPVKVTQPEPAKVAQPEPVKPMASAQREPVKPTPSVQPEPVKAVDPEPAVSTMDEDEDTHEVSIPGSFSMDEPIRKAAPPKPVATARTTTSRVPVPSAATAPSATAPSATMPTTDPMTWSVEEVVQWAKAKKYDDQVIEKLAEHEISGDALLAMDINMLKEIDIVAFGRRFHVANGIKELRERGVATSSAPLSPSVQSPPPAWAQVPTSPPPMTGSAPIPAPITVPSSVGTPVTEKSLDLRETATSASAVQSTPPVSRTLASEPLYLSPTHRTQLAPPASWSSMKAATRLPWDKDVPVSAPLSSSTTTSSSPLPFSAPVSTSTPPKVPSSVPTVIAVPSASTTSATDLPGVPRRMADDNQQRPATPPKPSQSPLSSPVMVSKPMPSVPQDTAAQAPQPVPLPTPVTESAPAPPSPSPKMESRSRFPLLSPRPKQTQVSAPSGAAPSKSQISAPMPVGTTTAAAAGVGSGAAAATASTTTVLSKIGPVDKQGWIKKRGERYNTWNARYLVLQGNDLLVLRDPNAVKVKSHIPLRGYKVYADDPSTGRHGFKILHDAERTHHFSHEDPKELRAWMKSVMKATIGRDTSQPVISSYSNPTISLEEAQRRRPRPPSPHHPSSRGQADSQAAPTGLASHTPTL
ncbi:actin filament polymerization regulator [Malassezia pachydermatis]|uniref:Boi1-bem1 protein-binding protein n=1 Tax=Malassezia pachydermatis TaxID=77020 RepID=A0A0M8MMD1_9BASI|nr:boi1-bem1 protein-binding protein [Malassezia pachydermatis]KOS15396.1 boi1-bem1 protein-binding protein [Malassezia pachydermatis]